MSKKKKIIICAVAAALVALAVVGGVLLYGNSKHVKVFKATGSGWNTVDVSWKASKEDVKAAIFYSTSKFDATEADAALAEPKDAKAITVKEGINLKDGKYQVTGMHPDTDYYITIAEKDKNGYKSALAPVCVHTKELTEPGDILKVDKITSDSVTLKWDDFGKTLKDAEGSDVSVKYNIKYSSIDSDDVKHVMDISQSTYTVAELEPLTKYSFELSISITTDGKTFETKPSKSISATTVPSTVTGLSASGKDDTSITVKWNAIKDTLPDGANVTYQLYGSDTKDGEYKLISDKLSDTSYTEEKLKSGSTRFYCVTVTVFVGENDKYVSEKCDAVSARAEAPKSVDNSVKTTRKTSGSNGSNGGGSATTTKKYTRHPGNATPELNAQARVIAQQIANEVLADKSLTTDLAKVQKAAQKVAGYASRCRYTMEGDYYASAYGVFIKGEYSCAGTARALGMVLECMGYSWKHVNEDGYTHQWVELTMDGQHGWADAFPTLGGQAGYGAYPFM